MAGGPNAECVPCIRCAGKANRVSEGIETDYYQCSECAEKFGIDWEGAGGPPDQPRWPPSAEEVAEIRRIREILDGLRSTE